VVRLALAALPLIAACTGEIESANLAGLDPKEAVAQQTWVEKALPIFSAKCVMCHDGSMPDIGYLAGDDDLGRRETLVSYVPRVVNLTAPQSSRVLTKGDHTATGGGPPMLVTEASDVAIWIRAEAVARPDTAPPIRTAQYTAMVCTDPSMPGTAACPLNTIDLTPLGAAGSIEFTVQQISGGIYVQQLKAKAGADGLYIEHPLLQGYAGGAEPAIPDPTDRFFATALNIMPNMEATFGLAGGETITGFSAADPMTIRFDVVEKYRPGT